jgi:uncharacterized membrane protein YdjX (TVP38/TMEM64 family)
MKWRWAGMALLLVAFIIVVTSSDVLSSFVAWVRRAGTWGALVFGLVYVVATVLMLPGSVLTLGAGFLYGPLWGSLLVSPASVAGATLAFLLSRGRARGWVEQRMGSRPRFVAVDRAIEQEGFKTVVLLRLSPVFPFVLLNYALGLTKVRTSHYVLGSALGMLPGTVFFVYTGSLVQNVATLAQGQAPSGGFGKQLFLVLGLVATFVVTWSITRAARRALDRSLRSGGDAERQSKER